MDGQPVEGQEPEVEIGAATKATLGLLGLFFAGAALLVLYRILKTLLRPFQSAPAKKKRPDKLVAAHLRAKPAQAPSGNSSGGEVQGQSIKQLLKQQKKQPHGSQAADAGSHSPLYVNTLKGHGDLVSGLDWTPDALALATACDDRIIRVFNLAGNLGSSSINFRRKAVTRGLVDVAFGSTAQQLLVLTKGSLDAASLVMYSLDRSGGFSVAWEIGNAHGGGAALTLAGSSRGVFATCGQKTDFSLFSSQGKQLAALDSSGLTNNGVSLSANGQFVAAATFTTDVKVHELVYDRAGAFQKTAKVMDLKGHTRQVSAVAFSPDGRRGVTASQDGTMRLWKLDVRFNQLEDAKCLVSVQQQVPKGKSYELLSYGAHGVIAGGLERSVHMIDSASGAMLAVIDDAHTQLTYLQWSPVPRRVGDEETYVLATAGDRRVRLWRSP